MKSLLYQIITIFTGLIMSLSFVACKSNPHKAEKIETEMEKKEQVNGTENLGIKDGNIVVQKKVAMNEELRKLQYEVYSLEDRVYGNRKYGSLGLYGSLKECRMNLSERKNGGDGKLIWTEPIDRVTEKEDDYKVGIDEKEKLVGVSEEFLNDRIKRFKGYRGTLEKRQDEYDDKIAICKTELKSRQFDALKEKENQDE